MKLPSLSDEKALGLLFTLFPGLLTFLIVRLLTAREKKLDAVEAILHGLAYTLLVNLIWELLCWPGSYIPTSDIIGLGLTSVALAIGLSLAINNRLTYRLLQRVRVTSEPEFATIWETTFRTARTEIGSYAVLTLDDERRIMGELRGFSPEQSGGHVMLAKWEWLTEDTKDTEEFTANTGWVLIPAERIIVVQFLPRIQDGLNEQQTTSTTT